MAIALEKLEDQLNCSICLDTYTNPKQLQCHHVYCQQCLVKLIFRDQQGQHILTCPNCRQVTPVPASGVVGLQAAFQTNKLLEIVEEHKKANVSASVKKVDITTPANPKPENIPIMCSEHGGKIVELYCETCGETICWECIMTGSKHHSHKYDKVSIAFEQYREEIMLSRSPLEQQLVTTERALAQLDKRCNEISKKREMIEDDIHNNFAILHEALDVRKNELISQLHQLTQAKLKSLSAQRDQLETTQAQMKSCLLVMKENLKMQCNQVAALQMKSTTIKQVKELATIFQLDMLEPNAEADLIFSALTDLSTDLQHYGKVYETSSPNPLKCYVTEEANTATVGEKSIVMLHTQNYNGKPCRASMSSILCELISEITGTVSRSSIKERTQSLYIFSYQPTSKGRHQLSIQVDGQHVRGSPFSLSVKSPVENLDAPILTIGGLNVPIGVAVNQRGEILVTENSRHCVTVFSSNGKKLLSFGTKGSGPGQFQYCHGVATDAEGNIFVTDKDNHRIQKFTAQGMFLATVGTEGNGPLQFNQPRGLAFNASNGRVYVVDTGNCRIQVLNSDLTYLSAIGKKGRRKGQFENPRHIACDSTGNIYVSECGPLDYQHIQVFTAEGKFLRVFGRSGVEREALNWPYGVAVDSGGKVYVSERDNHCVSIFNPEGDFVSSLGSKGKGPGQFKYPYGVAVDSSGVVYVCDHNNRVQLF